MDPKLKMDVPPQVREFAQKSVDQAERAISSFMDSASKSVAVVPGPMTSKARFRNHREESKSIFRTR
jgi:hypothetical protein